MSVYWLVQELKPILSWGRNDAKPSMTDLLLDEIMAICTQLDAELKMKLPPPVWERSMALMQFRLSEIRRLYNLECLERIQYLDEMLMYYRIYIAQVQFGILNVLCTLFKNEKIVYPLLSTLLKLVYADHMMYYNGRHLFYCVETPQYDEILTPVNNVTSYLVRTWK